MCHIILVASLTLMALFKNRAIKVRLATSIWYDTLMKNGFKDWNWSKVSIIEPPLNINNNVSWVPTWDSDQPEHLPRLIILLFASRSRSTRISKKGIEFWKSHAYSAIIKSNMVPPLNSAGLLWTSWFFHYHWLGRTQTLVCHNCQLVKY